MNTKIEIFVACITIISVIVILFQQFAQPTGSTLIAIPSDPHFEKLILSLRTCQAKEYSLIKEDTSYDDLLDAFRLSLKGYNIN